VTRRPVRGLAPIQAAPVNARPPGPATILGPDGRTWYRDESDQLYYDEARHEVYSQSALRDLIDRAAERLARQVVQRGADLILIGISRATSVAELRAAWVSSWTDVHVAAAHGRRAVLELPPKGAS
jgi:hypothetical protein